MRCKLRGKQTPVIIGNFFNVLVTLYFVVCTPAQPVDTFVRESQNLLSSNQRTLWSWPVRATLNPVTVYYNNSRKFGAYFHPKILFHYARTCTARLHCILIWKTMWWLLLLGKWVQGQLTSPSGKVDSFQPGVITILSVEIRFSCYECDARCPIWWNIWNQQPRQHIFDVFLILLVESVLLSLSVQCGMMWTEWWNVRNQWFKKKNSWHVFDFPQVLLILPRL